jgi:hypothetical protein
VGTALSPIGLIASSALRKGHKGGSTGNASVDGDADVGVANASYFRPGEWYAWRVGRVLIILQV